MQNLHRIEIFYSKLTIFVFEMPEKPYAVYVFSTGVNGIYGRK